MRPRIDREQVRTAVREVGGRRTGRRSRLRRRGRPRLRTLQWSFQFFVPLGAGLWGSTTDRTVVVSDAGVVVENPGHRQFRPWAEYECYSVTDEAVVRRAGWSAWGLRDLRRDAEELDDSATVTDALGECLPPSRTEGD